MSVKQHSSQCTMQLACLAATFVDRVGRWEKALVRYMEMIVKLLA